MSGNPDHVHQHVAHRGSYGSVQFAQVADGSYPAEEFWNDLTERQKAKFLTQFTNITNNEAMQHRNRQQFRQVQGPLFEFKRNDLKMRIFAFRHEKTWFLVYGFRGKNEDALPPREVKRALELMEQARRVLGIE